MNRALVVTAAVVIASAIISGAIAAHALEKVLGPELQENWQIAARYQMYGGFGLLIVALAADKFHFRLRWFAAMLISGIVLFSGSLYAFCFKEIYPDLSFFSRPVPVGGMLMIAAWILLIFQVLRKSHK